MKRKTYTTILKIACLFLLVLGILEGFIGKKTDSILILIVTTITAIEYSRVKDTEYILRALGGG